MSSIPAVLFTITMVIGWIANLVQIVLFALNVPDVMSNGDWVYIAVKALGLFLAPLGSVMGWVGFFI